MNQTPASNPANPYQQDAVRYLQKIMALFGDYKKRGLAFLKPAPGLSILDVGCGTGDDALALAGVLGPAGKIVGVDINPALFQAAAAKAKENNLPVTFCQGEAVRLPFDDNEFDRARADRVFQHLPEPAPALAEMIRVVKPGGWLCLLDVDWRSLLIDSPHDQITRAILDHLCRQNVNSAAGIQLYGLIKRSGLAEVEWYAETVCVTEWAIASMIWGLEPFAQKTVAAGVVSRAEATAWLDDLIARDRAGQFFASITGYVVRGRKP